MFVVILPWDKSFRYNDLMITCHFTESHLFDLLSLYKQCIMLKEKSDLTFLQFKVYATKGWLLPKALQEYLLAKYSVMLNVKTD